MTPTLFDVYEILGLVVDGDPITYYPISDLREFIENNLGIVPTRGNVAVIKYSWLKANFRTLLPEVPRYTRAYLLFLISVTIFTDPLQATVSIRYLQFLEHIVEVGRNAWGAAALAYLYRSIANVYTFKRRHLNSSTTLMQVSAVQASIVMLAKALALRQKWYPEVYNCVNNAFEMLSFVHHKLLEFAIVFSVVEQLKMQLPFQQASGIFSVGRVEEAVELLSEINQNSCEKPDIYTYTGAMDGLCKVGRSDEARELLEEAIHSGIKPNPIAYNALFNGYCKEGRALEGFSLLQEMFDREIEPDFISYATLLHGLLKWNEIEMGLQIYDRMSRIGFKPCERTLNKLARGLCRVSLCKEISLGDVERVFRSIRELGYVPSPHTYCLMIHSLSTRGEMEKALSILTEMIENGHPPKRMTYNTLIKGLCSKGRVDDAMDVLKLMFERETSPSKAAYNILIREFNQSGRVFDASRLYAKALKRGVVPHQQPAEILVKETDFCEDGTF
ncbi:pentatricopeptide repeat-containing protein At1g06710, mitochondrial [Amborella trichopoda]|uniref:pentatricopeptide repeat-containing protein At1g06710, mitochondrial n=1 Tax=Amborella trichopoda TaxID=13333 RepID=UPI0005D42457|nr:pentatricopeptide repeat-containing protein At1g06710, mitochondrial [Amborella trichopoda]|eukprot:XP_006842489.2 pentatricopeptide repeat-containing protein At1g06710, mitochondrial [Amborella trichopoda]